MDIEQHKKVITPQEVLMNCLADADRINKIIITTFNHDGTYECWQTEMFDYEKLGLLRQALVRVEKIVAEAPSEKL